MYLQYEEWYLYVYQEGFPHDVKGIPKMSLSGETPSQAGVSSSLFISMRFICLLFSLSEWSQYCHSNQQNIHVVICEMG